MARFAVFLLALASLLAGGSAPPARGESAVHFEANVGQYPEAVRFAARRGSTTVLLEDDGARVAVQRGQARAVVHLKVAGARRVTPRPSSPLATRVHSYRGAPDRWRSNIPTFGRVTYASVKDGVDVVYRGDGGAIEYDLVVAPGVDPATLAMEVDGDVRLDGERLVIRTPFGDVEQAPPVVYQDVDGERRHVAARYALAEGRVRFEVAAYDRARTLVIDPAIGFARTLGGGADDTLSAIATDASGNAYVAGATSSSDLPTTDGAFDRSCGTCATRDAFVAKLSPAGDLVWATYLGGRGDDIAHAIAVDPSGRAYAAGATRSTDFPTTRSGNGDPDVLFERKTDASDTDGFVTRLRADGSALDYSTFFRVDDADDAIRAIAADATGASYVTGETGGDAFIAKIAPSGSALARPLVLLEGEAADVGTAIGIDAMSNVWVAGATDSSRFPTAGTQQRACGGGTDAFVAKVRADFTRVDLATCLGGTGRDVAAALAVDAAGAAYVAGTTRSATGDLGAALGGDDAFVAKFAPGGALAYRTRFGGSGDDRALGIAVDAGGRAWVSGTTASTAVASVPFPLVNAVQATFGGGAADAFVVRLDAAGTRVIYGSYHGGEDDESASAIALSPTGAVFGGTTRARGEGDGFVASVVVPPLVISPVTGRVAAGSAQQFLASGGAGGPHVFAVSVNRSGATIDAATGAYHAGLTGDVTDEITVTDIAGTVATARLAIAAAPPGLLVAPQDVRVPPRGAASFAATGGTAPYVFGLVSNASGGAISNAGAYVAGARGNVVDLVRVVDAAGQQTTARVNVMAGIAVAPSRPAVAPSERVAFTASGGSGEGYQWQLAENGSGGTIDAATGLYRAGPGTNAVDRIDVVDSLGNREAVNVSVGGGLAITPASPRTEPGGEIAFTAVGGSGTYTWSLPSSPSGATIERDTGRYVAGETGSVTDVVQATDAAGNLRTVSVAVGPGLSVTPAAATVTPRTPIVFQAAGGSGSYTFSFADNRSGGTLTPGGSYVAGGAFGVDRVLLRDSSGGETTAAITVAAVADAGVRAQSFDDVTFGGGVDGCTVVGPPHGSAAGFGLAGVLVLFWWRRRRS